MGDRAAPPFGSQMGDKDWRLVISRDPLQHHPVPKLQEGRLQEIMTGDKHWPFVGGPRT